jgi:DNA-binding SARP family transcriptional activator
MSRLALKLLGTPEVVEAGRAVTAFRSAQTRGLLYYVAVRGRPESRTKLASLFWGDLPEANASANLRKTLTNLRHLVGPYLTISGDSVRPNADNPPWLDVDEFEAALQRDDPAGWQRAVSLYHGDFLEGFYVGGAPEFEIWQMAERYRMREKLLLALKNLAHHYADRCQYTPAIRHA